MKRIPALLIAVLAVSCSSTSQKPSPGPSPSATGGSGTQITLSETERTQIQSGVRTRLGNDQATFRTMIAQRDANNAVTVCGYVNPGSGDTPFIGMLGAGAFTVLDIGGPTERTIAVQHACHGRGIYI